MRIGTDSLAEKTFLGKLEMVEIYEFYDHPVLFACKNQKAEYYLAVLVHETTIEEKWIYARMSDTVYKMLKTSRITFREVFENPEDDFIFFIESFGFLAGQFGVTRVYKENIKKEWLPKAGEQVAHG